MSTPAAHEDEDSPWLTRRTGLTATAAPDTRHSERTVLDEATRPAAAEPAADVVFGPRGLSAGGHLIDVHDHYRQELAQVRDVLDRVKAGATGVGAARGELNRMVIRANDWTLGGYCQAQCVSITQHHGMEDAGIFPHLRKSQHDLGAVLDRLEEEHHAIHDLLEAVDAALIHLVRNPTDFGPITEAVDLLTDTLLSHFAYEERELIAPLSRHGFYPGQI